MGEFFNSSIYICWSGSEGPLSLGAPVQGTVYPSGSYAKDHLPFWLHDLHTIMNIRVKVGFTNFMDYYYYYYYHYYYHHYYCYYYYY